MTKEAKDNRWRAFGGGRRAGRRLMPVLAWCKCSCVSRTAALACNNAYRIRPIVPTEHKKSGLAALTLAAIGIVYGDIGTSPLYTMKEVFSPEHGLAFTPANLLGVVSLIVWGLTIIVSLKYVTLILRADNRGEGGIMALTALALTSVGKRSRAYLPLMLMGLAGATLFYGDSVITPAISVLSAIEGLEIATPAFTPYVVPLTVAVLIALYSLQARGTAGIGTWFGPVMMLWFASLAAMGLVNIWQAPQVLAALNPWHALQFLYQNRLLAFIALGRGGAGLHRRRGAVCRRRPLRAEADPHGLVPDRVSGAGLELSRPGCAACSSNPAAIGNPFYQQLGAWSIYPLVLLSTVATVIASQATITGTYSMTRQAIALGFLPRMRVEHTSASEIGQIYMPLVNWLQLAAVLLAVVGFGSSSHLAAAYGIAVTATMLVTTLLTFFVVRYGWRYNLLLCLAATGFFLVIDLAFFSANLLKILRGGWFPLLLGAVLFIVMLTWKRGRQLVSENLRKDAVPLEAFLQSLFIAPPVRVPGTAIFLRGETDGVPHAMLHNLLHNKVLHQRVVFLTVHIQEVPWVPASERLRIRPLGHECYQFDLDYGFKDEPNIPRALELAPPDLQFDTMETSWFIARQTVLSSPGEGMAPWRERLFIAMSRNARGAADYYRVPPNRVIELGTQLTI